jgi:hypothetical protein
LNCNQLREIQTELIEGFLDEDLRIHAEAHLALCTACADRMAREAFVKQAVASLVTRVPKAVQQAVEGAAGLRRGVGTGVVGRWKGFAAAAAAALLVATAVISPQSFGSARSLISASPLEAVSKNYEKPWSKLQNGPASGIPDLAGEGLDRWGTGQMWLQSGLVSVARYSGPGGRVAVYRLHQTLPRPPEARTVPSSSGFTGAWALNDGEYRTLVLADPGSTSVMIGTLPASRLVELAPSFKAGN